ncbi:MAG TPA: PAS domain S-box protein, partial [Anaerolineaceae bacterium]|nr:PAS domain S-box protein [Anaerolineaceae bacterium]
GYTEVELVGKIYTDLTYAEDLPMNKELFQQSLEGERRSFAMEKRYLHKNGNFVWVSLDSSLMYDPDGTPLYFITHMQDITRGKEAEEALKSSEARYRLLFERNPQAMWVHDNETLQFLAVNEAMERQYGYSQEEFLRMTILEIRPPQEIPSLLEMARSAGDSYTPSGVWKHRRKDMTLLDVETSSYRIDFGGRSARLVLAVDVTERTQAEAASQQRARELQLLSDVSSSLRQAQTRDAMISILMDKALEVTQADRCALFMFDREGINLASSVGFTTPLKASSLQISDPLFRFSQDESLLFIPNTCASGEFDGSDTFEELRQSVCGCVVLPLKTAEAVIGLIFLGWKDAHDFRPDEQRMLTAIAEIAGNSLHRSGMMELLEQRVSDRTRELSALYALSAVASEARDIHSAIEQSLLRILTAMPDKVGAIHLLNEAGQSLKLACSQGIPTCVLDRIKSIPVGDGLIGGVLIDQEPLLIADLDDIGEIPEWETPDRPAAYLGIPMRSHGKSTGVLSIFSKSANFINLEDIALLASAADQIGVTVENVRLRQQSEQVAVLRERERLARELHDSVTQSLYSLTLFSEVGHRMIHAGDTQQLDHVLSRLSETSLQALKEMRLLVYELRPSALEKDGLIGAIHKRLEAVEKRAGIHTVLLADDRLAFPFNVEEALYGITLEALNNSLKHARANSVTVEIQAIDGHVKLDVVDNGMGFDPKDVSRQGGFGLVTLRERTERLGGKLTIETLPGQGTRVSVVIPDNRLSG